VGPAPEAPVAYTPAHLAERILAERDALEARAGTEGERKTITALFADIKGSMELMEDLDPEDARSIVDPALKIMMDAVHRYEGYVVQSTGDGIFALFGAPLAHEDHAQRALFSALRMQEDSRRYAERLREEKGLSLQVRVGVNTGEVVLRSVRKDDLHADYTPIGHSTSLAARLESLATPGTTVVSEGTHRLTEGFFEFRPLGRARVKGVVEPVPIYQVTGVGPLRTRLEVAAARGLVKFVGRRLELEQMERAAELARQGHGQIVSVVGEPGVGKSRLCHEFKLRSSRGCLLLETFSASHGKAYPFLPLIDLLKGYFQIGAQDDERKRREKITGKALSLDRSLEDTLVYLFSLLGVSEVVSPLQQMDPQIRRRRTFEAVKRLLLRESLNRPLFLIIEDLHWLDSESQAWLDAFSESVATAPVLLLVNYRPEYGHGWGSRTYYTQLRLDALGKEEAEELVRALLGEGAGLERLSQLVLEKTEGNPFFVEELVQALVEEGTLAGERGNYRLTKSPSQLRISPTVQGILASRIDRLAGEEKDLLQTAAVVGKEFSQSLLRRVAERPEEDLYRLLSRLQAGEFIYEQPAFPEVEYTFKHALTQEVAYNSVLVARRRLLHERAARALEEMYGGRLDDHYNELAHHYSRSGDKPKAVEYLGLAGKQALQRSANEEAARQLSSALDLLRSLPPARARDQQELLLQTALGPALTALTSWAAPEVGNVYARALDLCRGIGETAQLFPALWGLAGFYLIRGELDTARELSERLLRLAESGNDPGMLVEAHFALGCGLMFSGEFAAALEHFDRAVSLYDVRRDRSLAFAFGGQDPAVFSLSLAAHALWHLGWGDKARKRNPRASPPLHACRGLFLGRGAAGPFPPIRGGAGEDRGDDGVGQGPRIRFLAGRRNDPQGLGARDGERRSRSDRRDKGKHRRPARYRLGGESPGLPCLAGRSVRKSRRGNGRAGRVGRGAGRGGARRAERLRGRIAPPAGRVDSGALARKGSRGRSVLSPGRGGRPPSKRQVVGASGGREPGPPVAEPGQAAGSRPAPRRRLRLVHRGARYGRPAGGEGVVGGIAIGERQSPALDALSRHR
jgi:class 3 adenylate cyclase/tetratricopeptide (TPR) repeat protein